MIQVQIREATYTVAPTVHTPFWEALQRGDWESGTFDILDAYVEPGHTVADVGCWIGALSLYLAAKGATVCSADPDPEAYQSLQDNLRLNPELAPRIRPHPVALTPKPGSFTMYARVGYGYSSTSLLQRSRDQVASRTTEGISLAEFYARNGVTRFDFLKVDIEGGEYALAEQLLALKQADGYGTLLLEMHYDHLNEALYQQKVPGRILRRLLMKLERLTHRFLFKKALARELRGISALCQAFPYVYPVTGGTEPLGDTSPEWLLRHRVDLLMADRPWQRPPQAHANG